MSDTSPILSLPYLAPSQAQKHVTVNEALTRLDILARLSVEGFGADTPPEAPAEGAVFALGAAPTGVWAGQPAGTLAAFTDGAWLFLQPGAGWLATTRATGEIRIWSDGAWAGPTLASIEAARVGVAATPDAENPLSVRGPAVLLSHDGAGHQVKVNKAAAADTGTLLFQTNWSGRAEMGLAGNDDWSLKVSANGSTWKDALVIDAATGRATGAAVQSSPTDAAPGKLMRADFGYGPATLVGTVSQSSGVPTGAAIETGVSPAGTWTRFADGTQICEVHGFESVAGAAATWTFPKPFGATPAITATAISGNNARIVTTADRSSHGVDIHTWDTSGSDAVAPACDLIAIGRWF